MMIKKLLFMLIFLGNVILGASVSSGIGMLSMSMKGNSSVPNQVVSYGLGLVNDFSYEKKKMQLSIYYQSTQNGGQMVLDELVFKTGLVRNIAPRIAYGIGIQLNHVLDSDFNGTLFPSSGIGVYVLGSYQIWPQFRGVIELASLSYSFADSYSSSLISSGIRFGFSTNL